MTILVTGGAGYIGSHTVLDLLQNNYSVLILDNFSNSNPIVLKKLEHLSGQKIPCVKGDIRDRALLKKIFKEHEIEAVIHFAGLKAVGESVEKPLTYYDNNVSGSIILFEEMLAAGVKNIVFSSSATVYGIPTAMPIREDAVTGGTTNPYGTSKYFIEKILEDTQKSHQDLSVVILRYFNPIGAHESGEIGEDPHGIPNNLLPYITQVAIGKLPYLAVFGDDYPTLDGTGVRDYIHVTDLAAGHSKALARHRGDPGVFIYNLGTGRGYSVLEIVRAFTEVTGQKVPYRIVPRRPGDIATCYADASLAERELNWKTEKDLSDMLTDNWRWQQQNSDGYATKHPKK